MNSRHVESEIFAMLGKRWGIFEQSRSVTTSVFRALLKLECLSMFCFFFFFCVFTSVSFPIAWSRHNKVSRFIPFLGAHSLLSLPVMHYSSQ